MKTYNGHPSYNYWNVALWISNDEGLYRLALDCLSTPQRGPRRNAALAFIEAVKDTQGCRHTPTTPDGAPYTVAAVLHAMRGLEG